MLKALLIDDEPEFTKGLKERMTGPGDETSFLRFSRVDVAPTCAEALRLAESGVDYDLIVYDLLLPWDEGGEKSRKNGFRLIGEIRPLQPSACGILATNWLGTQEATTIKKLGVVGRLVAKHAGMETLLVNAQDAILEAAQMSSRRLSASYRLQAGIHEAMNSLNNVLAAVSEIEKICTPGEGFVPSRSLPLICEEVEHIRRFQQAAARSLRNVNPDEQARREPCDLPEIAAWCASYLRSQDHKGKRRIELDVEEPIPVTLGVREELRQMILVLATNSLQATEEGGRVAIHLRCEAEGDRDIRVTIEDDGRGVSEEDRSRIFDLGFTTHEGLGMGLFLARAFAWNHGGRIEVESPPGGGTRVMVRLPVRGVGADE